MTTSTARHAWRPVIDMEDTVTIHHLPIGEQTKRLFPIARDNEQRPDATARLSFGVLSESGEQPLIGIDPQHTAALDALQLQFQAFAGADMRPGRHRAPGLLARTFGRKGGAL